MYNDQYHPQVKRDLKKLSSELRERIKTEHIPAHPEGGDTLVGDLKGIWSYHSSNLVIILMIGKRGEFYQFLRRRMKGK